MNSPIIRILLTLTFGSILFALGHFVGRKGSQVKDATLLTKAAPMNAIHGSQIGEVIEPSAQEAHLKAINQLATEGSIKDQLLRIFQEVDANKRRAAFQLFLLFLTPNTALEAKQAMVSLTATTGKTAHEDWHRMLRRIGELAGEKGIDSDLQDAGSVLVGWATTDPQGALAFLQTRQGSDRDKLAGDWLRGVMQKQPESALAKLLEEPNFTTTSARTLMAELVNIHGISGGQTSLQKAIDAAGHEKNASPMFSELFTALADTMFHQCWINNTPADVCKWLELQKDAPYLTPAILHHAGHDYAYKGDPKQAVDWIMRVKAPTSGQPSNGFNGIGKALSKDLDRVAQLDDARLRLVLQHTSNGHRQAILKSAKQQNSPQLSRLESLVSQLGL